jgi:hypothetical protein
MDAHNQKTNYKKKSRPAPCNSGSKTTKKIPEIQQLQSDDFKKIKLHKRRHRTHQFS